MPILPTEIFTHFLIQLERMLQKAQASNVDEIQLLQARLSKNMFPLHQQVTTALSFPIRACYPIVGLEIPQQKLDASSLEVLIIAIRETKQKLAALKPQQFVDFENRDYSSQAGFAELQLSGNEFIHMYMLPNFLFHMSMVYAILRQQGVSVGKADYDGYHQYPDDFEFAD